MYFITNVTDSHVYISDTEDNVTECYTIKEIDNFINQDEPNITKVFGAYRDLTTNELYYKPYEYINCEYILEDVSDSKFVVSKLFLFATPDDKVNASRYETIYLDLKDMLALELTGHTIAGFSKYRMSRIKDGDDVILGRTNYGEYFVLLANMAYSEDIHALYFNISNISPLCANYFSTVEDALSFCRQNSLNIINDIRNKKAKTLMNLNVSKFFIDGLIVRDKFVIEVRNYICKIILVAIQREYSVFVPYILKNGSLYYSYSKDTFYLYGDGLSVVFRVTNRWLASGRELKHLNSRDTHDEFGVCLSSIKLVSNSKLDDIKNDKDMILLYGGG